MSIPPTVPAKPRRQRKRREIAANPVEPFALVSAIYSPDDVTVTLTFNRAINIGGFDASAITINDPVYLNQFLTGDSATMDGDSAVIVPLIHTAYPTGEADWMTATEENGITAMDDGTHWDGLTEYPIG